VILAALSTFAMLGATQTTDWERRTVTPESAPYAKGMGGKKDGRSFSCFVRYVTDGDTFRCADGTRVRLSSIDTPEMPGSCRPGRSCAPGDPYAAKAALKRLIGGRTVQCEPVGMSYNGYAVRLPQFDKERRLCR
jgi:endonuclease YncB( thermonuclease family)